MRKRRLSQIPHTTFDDKQSSEAKFKNTMVDFRFQLIFRNYKEKYKQFLNAFLSSKGVYAKLDGKFIHITQRSIKRVGRPYHDLILPDDWIKYVKIIDND